MNKFQTVILPVLYITNTFALSATVVSGILDLPSMNAVDVYRREKRATFQMKAHFFKGHLAYI